MITIEDFFKTEMKVGEVVKAEEVKESRKLIRLMVNVGEKELRTIFTGVRTYGYKAEDFEGKKFLFVTNLEPKKIMAEESQGMILAVDSEDGRPLFVKADDLPVGKKIR